MYDQVDEQKQLAMLVLLVLLTVGTMVFKEINKRVSPIHAMVWAHITPAVLAHSLSNPQYFISSNNSTTDSLTKAKENTTMFNNKKPAAVPRTEPMTDSWEQENVVSSVSADETFTQRLNQLRATTQREMPQINIRQPYGTQQVVAFFSGMFTCFSPNNLKKEADKAQQRYENLCNEHAQELAFICDELIIKQRCDALALSHKLPPVPPRSSDKKEKSSMSETSLEAMKVKLEQYKLMLKDEKNALYVPKEHSVQEYDHAIQESIKQYSRILVILKEILGFSESTLNDFKQAIEKLRKENGALKTSMDEMGIKHTLTKSI